MKTPPLLLWVAHCLAGVALTASAAGRRSWELARVGATLVMGTGIGAK